VLRKLVPSRRAALIGGQHLVAGLDQPVQLEAAELTGVRPATLEIPVSIDADVERTREFELLVQAALDQLAIAGRKGSIAVTRRLSGI
jgi:hypothetical protein